MGVRRGTHTGFVGEQAAGHTVADGFLDTGTDDAAGGGRRIEGAHKDHLEGGDDLVGIAEDHEQAADDIQQGHEGHHLFGHGSDAADAAEEDEGTAGGDDQAHDQGRHVKSGLEGVGDGVGLHHVADATQGDDDGDREEHGQLVAAETFGDVVGGAAGDVAGVVAGAVDLGQHGFGKDGGHAEEGGDPHPEDGAGTTHSDGGGGTGQVAGTHLGGDGGGHGLEGAHAVLVGALALQGKVTEEHAHGLSELADLDELQPDGEVYAHTTQQRDKAVHAPDEAVDVGDKFRQFFHGFPLRLSGLHVIRQENPVSVRRLARHVEYGMMVSCSRQPSRDSCMDE